MVEQYKHEQAAEHRRNYDSLMLYFIAQPTRKNPEALPQFEPLFGTRKELSAPKKSAEQILLELLS